MLLSRGPTIARWAEDGAIRGAGQRSFRQYAAGKRDAIAQGWLPLGREDLGSLELLSNAMDANYHRHQQTPHSSVLPASSGEFRPGSPYGSLGSRRNAFRAQEVIEAAC
jgi:hypothetical protein